jgi:hypothetical protein
MSWCESKIDVVQFALQIQKTAPMQEILHEAMISKQDSLAHAKRDVDARDTTLLRRQCLISMQESHTRFVGFDVCANQCLISLQDLLMWMLALSQCVIWMQGAWFNVVA